VFHSSLQTQETLTVTFTTRIKQHERGLRFRHGELVAVLAPGRYRLWSRLIGLRRDRIDVVSMLDGAIEHTELEALTTSPAFAAAFSVVTLGDEERAVAWQEGRVIGVYGAGRHAFAPTVTIERFAIDRLRFEHARIEAILAHPSAAAHLNGLGVEAHEEVLLFLNGRLVDRLGEGRHVLWRAAGRAAFKCVDRRERILDVSGQEILTSDKVTLRINLVVGFQVTDPLLSVTRVADADATLYREAQLALRTAVGTRTLDALLADKESIGHEVRNALVGRAAEFGVTVRSVGLRDVILPGEMREILNRVIEAEKAAQANLIRRREETAAARSQANTARLLADNPALARLRELEVLQEILAGAKTSFVFGQGDAMTQLKAFIGRDDSS